MFDDHSFDGLLERTQQYDRWSRPGWGDGYLGFANAFSCVVTNNLCDSCLTEASFHAGLGKDSWVTQAYLDSDAGTSEAP
jgi:hypothetical protein